VTDFGRIFKNISWISLNISQILKDRGQRVKKFVKIAENSHVLTERYSRIPRISAGYQGYQPDINAFCTA